MSYRADLPKRDIGNSGTWNTYDRSTSKRMVVGKDYGCVLVKDGPTQITCIAHMEPFVKMISNLWKSKDVSF